MRPSGAQEDDLWTVPGDSNGTAERTSESVYDNWTNQTASISPNHLDFTKVVVCLRTEYTGEWGQLDIDDVRIANTPNWS